MKKTLLTTALLLAFSFTTMSAEAFCWRNLNPANWGTCPKCEKTASCKCKKHKCTNPCEKENVCPTHKQPGCACKKHKNIKSETNTTKNCNPCQSMNETSEE